LSAQNNENNNVYVNKIHAGQKHKMTPTIGFGIHQGNKQVQIFSLSEGSSSAKPEIF
jgi:hypothetical protein